MKNFNLLMLVVFSFCTIFGFSQNILEGKVTNVKEKPVANASIYFDSIYSNVKTDNKGCFKVKMSLKFDSIKYTMLKVADKQYLAGGFWSGIQLLKFDPLKTRGTSTPHN